MKLPTHVVIVHDKYQDFADYFFDEESALRKGRCYQHGDIVVVVAKIIERVNSTRQRVLDSVDQ